MAHNGSLEWMQALESTFPPTQFVGENGALPDQFNNYQPQQSSPSYVESTGYNGAAYADLSNMSPGFDASSTYDSQTPTTYSNVPYQLPTSQYCNSLASTLPDLRPEVVQAVLEGGDNINNSIEKLTLEGQSHLITGADQLLTTAHQRLAQYPSYNCSMDSASTSGSISNVPSNDASQMSMQVEHGAPPHRIEILEEPMEFGYRFRYEVEGKAHGGLQGQSSKNNGGLKRTNKIYPEIQICNVPDHINEIEIEARLVSATEDYFPHPNKCSGKDCNEKGVFRKLLRRNEHPEFRLMLNNLTILQIKKGDQTNSLMGQLIEMNEHQMRLKRPDLVVHDVKSKVEELVKSKHNGVVRIRFEASYHDATTGKWQVAHQHSNSVHDQKQTNAAELRICRISASSAPAAGGQEIFLLCEKVTKDDIKVKFQEGSWEVDGIFQGTDVHYQYAIVFRVPPYKKSIKKPVRVNLKLFRPSTGTYSKAVPFTYHPDQSIEESTHRKKRRIDSSRPSDMGGYKPFGQPFDEFRPPSNDGAGPSHSYMPGGGYQGGSYYNRDGSPPSAHSATDEMPMDLSKNNSCPLTIEDVEGDNAVKVMPTIKLEKVESEKPAVDTDDMEASHKESIGNEEEAVVSKKEPSSDSNEDDSNSEDVETDGCPIIPRRSIVMPEPVLESKTAGAADKMEEMLGSLSIKEKVADSSATKVDVANQDMEKKRVQHMSLESHVAACEDFVVESLMNYAITGDHLYFISQFRYFLGATDEYGDNSLHMAVINGQPKALTDMLSICLATKTTTAINQLNDKLQTPIHVATIIRSAELVEILLRHDADPTIADGRGSNCFHTAAQNKDYKTMQLLCQWLVRKDRDRELLDELNYDGESALHKAVHVDSMECMQELLRAGANVNTSDGTSGKTALHYTVQRGNIVNTAELLVCPKIDVNIAAYDGNTPLHLAISLNNEDITKLLIKSGANPRMRNRQLSCYMSDEEIYGLDSYELCEGNEQMLAVIDETPKRSEKPHSVLSDSIQSLPEETVDRLSMLLDRESKDWKRLANFFDLSSLIDFMEKQANPTVKLFNYLDNNDKTIRDLKKGLSKIARQDCIDVIERAFMLRLSQTHKRNSREASIKDSGFGECPSENLKSDYSSGYLR